MAQIDIDKDLKEVTWFGRLSAYLLSALGALALALLVLFFLGRAPSSPLLGQRTAWYLSRSTGTVAYLLLSASTIWGLLLSSRIVKETIPSAVALALHTALGWLAVALAGFHAFVLLFDNYYTYHLLDLLLPFAGPYRPAWVGLGIVGFYLAILTSASFSWRKWIGREWWRRLHTLTFVAFLLVTVHGLAAGTDSGEPGMRIIYLGSALTVLFLTSYRLLAP